MRTTLLSASALIALACSSPTPSTFGTDPGGDGGTVVDPSGDDGGNTFGKIDAAAGPDTSTFSCVPDPANFDIPKNGCDDDGDGQVDNAPACDTGLPANGDATAFAKSLGLCQMAGGGKWGLVSATYTNSFGSSTAPPATQHGILGKFGAVVKPREGKMLGVLSSGYAQEYDQCQGQGPFKGGCSMQTSAAKAPTGYPKNSPACKGVTISNSVNDMITVKLQVKVPHNAKGLAFDFNFGSGEWPEFVCTDYNDAFIAYLTSAAFNGGKPDNISFDAKNNPVSVNNGFFDRCSPKNASVACLSPNPSTSACAGGDAELKGTGFYEPGQNCGQNDSGGGMTGWLTTKAPVKADETITLEFMIWDTGDHIFDSSVLLDNFTWQGDPTVTGTDRPPVN